MAFEAFKKDPKLTIRAASRIYEVLCTTLMERRVGKQLRSDIPINSKKFINLEEKVVLDHIIELVD